MNLEQALAEFDAAETTLRRLEAVWSRMSARIPPGIVFVGSSPDGIEYENLTRTFAGLVAGLPAIGGWKIDSFPLDLDEIAQCRLDARDLGEIDFTVSVERQVEAPGEGLRDYRFRFNRARRTMIRRRAQELIARVNELLASLTARIGRDRAPVADPDWPVLLTSVQEIERLLGSSTTRTGRWRELSRHIAFGQGCDLHDIAEIDWPSVLKDIEGALYDEHEPIPVEDEDLAELAATQPHGPVSTRLAWNTLDDEAFERLVFNIIGDAPGYENARWLTRTHAPDRGRDLSVDRVVTDALSGTGRQRIIIQCKHWLSKSIAPSQLSSAVAAADLWNHPPVDVLILVTSGRFSADAVAWFEKHNHDRRRPTLELWPETHLESLLAQRPHLVAQFGLRPRG